MSKHLTAAWEKLKNFFFVDLGDGAKKTIHTKRFLSALSCVVILMTVASYFMSGGTDITFYDQDQSEDKDEEQTAQSNSNKSEVDALFAGGSKELAEEQKREMALRRNSLKIKYFAPQLVGVNKGPKAVRMGARLLGFLITNVDTREPALVSVVLPRGGVSESGAEIPKDSVLIGSFSYNGGDKVSLQFDRLDTPDGESLKVVAVALDSKDYTAGVRGKVFSDNTVKLASTLGLSMAASMTDVLTEREALSEFGYAEVRPTMRNALLQGLSGAAKDQASRTSEDINSKSDYVVIPKGKEVIVQLTEDYLQ